MYLLWRFQVHTDKFNDNSTCYPHDRISLDNAPFDVKTTTHAFFGFNKVVAHLGLDELFIIHDISIQLDIKPFC